MSTVTSCTSTSRPGSPSAGDMALETDTKRVICYDGSAWQTYEADFGPYVLDGSNTLTVSPIAHYDAGFINGVDATGNPSNAASLTGVWTAKHGADHVTIAQATGTAQPTFYTSGQNSKPYLSWDGGDILWLERPISAGSNIPWTIWLVGEKTGSSFGFINERYESNVYFNHSNDDDYYYHSHAISVNPVGFPKDPQTWMLHRNASNETIMFHNGDNTYPSGSPGTKDHPMSFVAIGKNKSGSYGLIGKLYEIMFFMGSAAHPTAGQLSDADLNKLNAYTQTKYDFTTAPTDF